MGIDDKSGASILIITDASGQTPRLSITVDDNATRQVFFDKAGKPRFELRADANDDAKVVMRLFDGNGKPRLEILNGSDDAGYMRLLNDDGEVANFLAPNQ